MNEKNFISYFLQGTDLLRRLYPLKYRDTMPMRSIAPTSPSPFSCIREGGGGGGGEKERATFFQVLCRNKFIFLATCRAYRPRVNRRVRRNDCPGSVLLSDRCCVNGVTPITLNRPSADTSRDRNPVISFGETCLHRSEPLSTLFISRTHINAYIHTYTQGEREREIVPIFLSPRFIRRFIASLRPGGV